MSQPLRAEFEAIQGRWKELCQNGHLPARADFPVESLTPWIGHIQIVERVGDGDSVRHRVRLVGTRIVYYEVYSAFYSCSEAAISSQLERLILPLAADGTTIDQFLVAIYRAQT